MFVFCYCCCFVVCLNGVESICSFSVSNQNEECVSRILVCVCVCVCLGEERVILLLFF